MSDDLDLAIARLLDDDGVAQVARAAVDLDPLVEELLEGGDVEDLVVCGLGGVDRVLGVAIVVLVAFAFCSCGDSSAGEVHIELLGNVRPRGRGVAGGRAFFSTFLVILACPFFGPFVCLPAGAFYSSRRHDQSIF